MAQLVQKDPCLAGIFDVASSRNLLEDPRPPEAKPDPGKSVTLTLRVENGLEAPVEIVVTSDQDWLVPKTKKLSLMGGEKLPCMVEVHSKGDAEFGNLCFAWKGETEQFAEYVLIWRKMGPTKPVYPVPIWMADGS